MRSKDIVGLIFWVGICLVVGWIGARVTAPALADWYRPLAKPDWTPPDIAFPIVWTALYVLMGVAAWLVWRRSVGGNDPRRWVPLVIFIVQLALNSLWSLLFFGLHSPGLGLVEILVLLLAIVATIVAFRRVSPTAAWLLLPYLLWVGYATALNFAVWRMNMPA